MIVLEVIETADSRLLEVGTLRDVKDVAELLGVSTREIIDLSIAAPELECCGYKFKVLNL
jgi:hypothetical protein